MIKAIENWRYFLNYSELVTNSLSDIDYAKTICDPSDRIRFLVKRANFSLYHKEYNHAAVIAWYILSQIDKDSDVAKSILKEAYKKIFVV